MSKIKVLEGQSLLDIAIQEYGTVEAVIDIALVNYISPTEELEAGQELVLPDSTYKNIDIADYYTKKQIKPATAKLDADIEAIVAEISDDDDINPVYSREYTKEYKDEFGSTI